MDLLAGDSLSSEPSVSRGAVQRPVIKIVRPTRGLLQGGKYVPSEHTDVWATFARLWAETSEDIDAKNPYLARRKK